jgi:hypothetical protein
MLALLVCVLFASPAAAAAAAGQQGGSSSSSCATTTAALQAILDQTAAQGGGWAPLPCGFHATLALHLPSTVKLGSAHCASSVGAVAGISHRPRLLLTLGACLAGKQQHIISVDKGKGQVVSGVVFDHSNLTDPSSRSSCAVTGGSGSVGFLLENSQFLHINTTSQGFSAIQMAGCVGCIVRGNHVPASGGDALNFNSGGRSS